MSDQFKLLKQPELKNPTLLVAWSEDASTIGSKVVARLMRTLPYERFAEIEPADFFLLAGITVEDNLVQFPESRFYWCPGVDLVLFLSDPPAHGWYMFLDLTLRIAREHCHAREIITLGGIISLTAHTIPRRPVTVFNSPEFKAALEKYDVSTDLEYRTQAGQRPTLNSYLLWLASKQGIPAANLWLPTPFYLLSAGDPAGAKMALEFLSRRCALQLDLSELDTEIRQQAEGIAELRSRIPEVDRSISRLEGNQALSEEDNARLVKAVEEFFRRGG